MNVALGPLYVDAAAPDVLERFWRGAIGHDAADALLRIVPQRTGKVAKNRVHLDLYAHDVAPLLAAGARVLAEHLPGWVTLADVEGNEFCAFPDPAMDPRAPARPFAVCTDSARPEELAAWWARRLGVTVEPGPDGTPRWLYGPRGWENLVWKFVRVSDERMEPNRWRWSLDGVDGPFVDPQGNDVSVAFPGSTTATGTSSTSAVD